MAALRNHMENFISRGVEIKLSHDSSAIKSQDIHVISLEYMSEDYIKCDEGFELSEISPIHRYENDFFKLNIHQPAFRDENGDVQPYVVIHSVFDDYTFDDIKKTNVSLLKYDIIKFDSYNFEVDGVIDRIINSRLDSRSPRLKETCYEVWSIDQSVIFRFRNQIPMEPAFDSIIVLGPDNVIEAFQSLGDADSVLNALRENKYPDGCEVIDSEGGVKC